MYRDARHARDECQRAADEMAQHTVCHGAVVTHDVELGDALDGIHDALGMRDPHTTDEGGFNIFETVRSKLIQEGEYVA